MGQTATHMPNYSWHTWNFYKKLKKKRFQCSIIWVRFVSTSNVSDTSEPEE